MLPTNKTDCLTNTHNIIFFFNKHLIGYNSAFVYCLFILLSRSPTAAGGLLGMTRQWFVELGGFNRNLRSWGGESLELSLHVWMCGGHVEIVPCSRVGHIGRSELPLGESATHFM